MQWEREHSKSGQVLQTIYNLIVEMYIFKGENEQLKRAHEKQQEINEMLVQILHNRNNGKEQRTKINKNEENGRDAKGDGISSNDAQGS